MRRFSSQAARGRSESSLTGAIARIENEGLTLLEIAFQAVFDAGIEIAQRNDADDLALILHRQVTVSRLR